ncbi:MAG: peptidylprolyl isomerase [Mangrovibacterium sp.]
MLKRIILFFTIITPLLSFAQDKVINQIVAVVGNNIILKSDVEEMYRNNVAQGISSNGDMKCEILEDLLVEKLLVAEAQLDTNIVVSDNQINQQLDSRMQYFVQNLGSEKAVEAYFKKPITEIKSSLKEVIENQLYTQQMRSTIIKNVTITPAEVRYKYRNTSKANLPQIDAQVEYAQISIHPEISVEEENKIKARLRDFKHRIEDEGEDFATLAVLYSEGPSASNGGELGYMGKAQLDPAYANAAFNLKEGKVSNVVKSDFGYHIIQLIDRKGEQANTRHIILKPTPSTDALKEATSQLDSLASLIRREKITFSEAAAHFSSDKNSRNGGGIALNPTTMSSKWTQEELDPQVGKVLAKLKINEISDPFKTIDDKQQVVYKIVKLIDKTEAHPANPNEDYKTLSDIYLEEKQNEAIEAWVKERQEKTYIRIDDSYSNCNFEYKNWIK